MPVSFGEASALRSGPDAPAEVSVLVGFQILTPGRSTNEGGTVVKVGTASVSRFSRIVRIRHRELHRGVRL